MTFLIGLLGWLCVGGVISGFVVAQMGWDFKKSSSYDDGPIFRGLAAVALAFFWPLTLIGVIAFYPARWAYKKGKGNG